MAERHRYPNAPPNIKRLHHECKNNLRALKRKQILNNGLTAAAKRRLLFVPDDELTMYNIPPPKKKIKKDIQPVITDAVKVGEQNFNVNSSIPTTQESTNHPCTANSLHVIDSSTPNGRFRNSSSPQCSSLSLEFDQKLDLNSPIPTTSGLQVPPESSIILSEDSPPKIIHGNDRA